MQERTKSVTSRASITGIFVTLVLILGLPLAVLVSQERQEIRQRAQSPQNSNLPTMQIKNGNISGYIFNDLNRNGERDYDETGANGIRLIITRMDQDSNLQRQTVSIVSTLISDVNGYFKYNLENEGNYLVQLLLPEGYKTVNVNPRELFNVGIDSKEIMEFGIFPAQTLGASDYDNTGIIPTPTIFQRLPSSI